MAFPPSLNNHPYHPKDRGPPLSDDLSQAGTSYLEKSFQPSLNFLRCNLWPLPVIIWHHQEMFVAVTVVTTPCSAGHRPSNLAQDVVSLMMSTHSSFIFSSASTITSMSFPKGPQVLFQAAHCSSMLSLHMLSYIIKKRSEDRQAGDWTEKPLTWGDIASALSPWRSEDFALQNSPTGLRIHCIWDGSRGWGLQP